MTKYDAIIIGTGQAGPSLARRMAARGMQVAIIERARFGGTASSVSPTCPGCTQPSSILVCRRRFSGSAMKPTADAGSGDDVIPDLHPLLI